MTFIISGGSLRKDGKEKEWEEILGDEDEIYKLINYFFTVHSYFNVCCWTDFALKNEAVLEELKSTRVV